MIKAVQILTPAFIAGILVARFTDIPELSLIPVFFVSAFFLLMSLIFYLKGKSYQFFLIFPAFLGGAYNLQYHMATDVPGHLALYLEESSFKKNTAAVGTITAEPEIRERYTLLELTPEYIKKNYQDSKILISRGKIAVRIYPSIGDLFYQLSYGDKILIKDVALTPPPEPNNPGLFNYSEYLSNRNFFSQVSIRNSWQIEKMGVGDFNFLVRFALSVKNNILQTIKKTMPFPESTFLGGVLLGLRFGLPGDIVDQFRAAGVSHVLAVSGLHVTIITALFMGIFSMMKMPKRAAGPIIIFFLIIFTLITGARPSTVRAAIMNSLGLILYYIIGRGIKSSLLFAISASALLILLNNPLILGEASFLFSFTAVLSLGLLTNPVSRFMKRRLRSPASFAVLFFAVYLIGAFITDSRFYLHPPNAFWILLALIPLSFFIQKFTHIRFTFDHLPFWLRSFVAAQAAIQLGMAPLTAQFFNRVSVSAPIANFVAIPLIGVIVQIGLIAGLLAFIPVVGIYLALILNAFNWLCVKFFLGTAAFFSNNFPYPRLTPPGLEFFLIYFFILFLFMNREKIIYGTREYFPVWKKLLKTSRRIRLQTVTGCILLAIIAASGAKLALSQQEEPLRILFIDPRSFNVGKGSSVLVQTPAGKSILIDGATRRASFYDRIVDFDLGERLLTPLLLKKNISTLDLVVLTNPLPQNIGGLISVVKNFRILLEADSLPVDEIPDRKLSLEDIAAAEDDPALEYLSPEEVSMMLDDLNDYFELLGYSDTRRLRLTEGMTLYSESLDSGKTLTIDVLNPPADPDILTGIKNRSIVLQINYGELSVLLPSNINEAAESRLVEKYGAELRSQVLLVPDNGSRDASSLPFINAVSPEVAIFQYKYERYANRYFKRNWQKYSEKGITCFRTDKSGAVSLFSDGSTMRLETVFQPSFIKSESQDSPANEWNFEL